MVTSVQELRALIEQERERFAVPGLAAVVVVDGQVLLAEGFGQRDPDEGLPVTEKTLFRIASDTKCFTAGLLTVLAAEGQLDLDRPVREYIPWFALHDPLATQLVSTRDLLSHRTGLPRHDLVWYGNAGLSREELVRSMRHLPLSRQLRQTWQYNNLCYEAAGYLTEQLTGLRWAEAVQQRLLDPLGMDLTVFRPDAADRTGDVALPYEERAGVIRRVSRDYRRESTGGPAGGIISCAADVAQWLLARLGLPTGGQRVLPDAALAELHRPAMLAAEPAVRFPERQPSGYALGCAVESYRGHRVIRHGGNLVGFSSDVCVAPDARAAVAVFANLHATAARDAIALLVLDRVLGLDPAPWGQRYAEIMGAVREGARAATERRAAVSARRPSSRPLTEFAGRYVHPAYGTLTLTVAGEQLVPAFHEIGGLELRHRDYDAWELWLDDFESGMPAAFRVGLDGGIDGIAVSVEPAVAPILFTRLPEVAVPRELAERLAGSYHLGPLTVEVTVGGDGVLSVAVPGQGSARLEPRAELTFRVPDRPITVTFTLPDDAAPATEVAVDPVGIFTRRPD